MVGHNKLCSLGVPAAYLFIKFIALVVLTVAHAIEYAEGHLEGRRRTIVLREDDRVICQMGKAVKFTAPCKLSACLTPCALSTHIRRPAACSLYARGSGSDGIRVRESEVEENRVYLIREGRRKGTE